MLRRAIISKIYKSLEKSPFSLADFDVKTPEGDAKLLEIEFIPHPKFRYTVGYTVKGGHVLNRSLSPGVHQIQEGGTIGDLNSLHEEVAVWAKLIREELRASMPVFDEIDDIRKMVEDHIKQDVKDEHEPFTQDEIETLNAKFDDMMARFEELKERQEITQQELNRLKREIGAIRENMKTFPKGVWYRTAASKLFGVFAKLVTSSEGRKVIASAAKKALGLE